MTRILLTAALLALTGTACASSHVNEHFGESHRTLTAQQIENPEAGGSEPVYGVGATTADQATATYHRRQTEQASEPARETLFDYVSER